MIIQLHKKIELWKTRNMPKKAVMVTVLLLLILGNDYLSAEESTKETPSAGIKQAISVVVTPVQSKLFERFVAVQGNLESKNYSVVSPRISGTIEQMCVDEGDVVLGGETLLFKTDSVKLQQAVEIQKRLLSVEECTLRQAIANLEKTEADFHKSELDYRRFERLVEKKAVTVDAFEQQQSRYKQLQASVKLAKATVDLASANVERAKADLSISEKDLADTMITAPITGKISYRLKEPGEMGQPGEPVVRIDDTSLLEVSGYLPAVYYAAVEPNETTIEVAVFGKKVGSFPVSYKSPVINPALRTFEVKCLVENPSGGVAAGAMAEVKVVLEKRQGLAVPSSSIQQRGNKSVIFIVVDNKAHQLEVQTGLENNGWTEVISLQLNEQSIVVSMGQEMLNDGQSVSVQKENN